MSITFAQPEQAGNFDFKQHLEHLIIIKPQEYRTGIQTKYSDADGTDAVKADVICVECEDDYTNVLLFPMRIIAVTRDRINQMVLGRLTQEPSKMGNPAWTLAPYTDQQAVTAQTFYTQWQQKQATNTFTQPAAANTVQPAQQTDADAIAALKAQLAAQQLA